MKIIISHDVDHINVSEHLLDLVLIKFIIRSKIELFKGKINFKEFVFRLSELFSNKWNRIEEIIEFNKQHNIPSTFFVGVNNGVGLNYSLKQAIKKIKLIQSEGFDVGIHGIVYDNVDGICMEFEKFSQIVGYSNFGIRMHYLRKTKETLNFLSKAGFLFDTSIPHMGSAYKLNNIIEFPIHIMDGWMIEGNKRWQIYNLNEAMDNTIKLINEGVEKKIDYFSIIFHDRYFSDAFYTWKMWYINVIKYLKQNSFEFVDYKSAIKEINCKQVIFE